MTLTCKIRIDAIEQFDNPIKPEWRDPWDEPIHTKVIFSMLEGFETAPYTIPQIEHAVSRAEPKAHHWRVNYQTESRTGTYTLEEAASTLSIGLEIDMPILTFLNPPKTADEIVAALERDPANLVITFYSGCPDTGWIEPDDKGSNPDAPIDNCEILRSAYLPELAKAMRDGRIGMDSGFIIQLASQIETPLNREEFEAQIEQFETVPAASRILG